MSRILAAGAVLIIVVLVGLLLHNRGGSSADDEKKGAAQSQPSTTPPPASNPPAVATGSGVRPTPVRAPQASQPPPEPLKIDFAAASAGHLGKYPIGHKNPVTGVVILPGGKQAVSISRDRSMMLWNVLTGELVRTFTVPEGSPLTSVAVSADGRFAATGDDDGVARVWDLESGESKHQARTSGKCGGLAFSKDGQLLVVGSKSKENPVQIWRWKEDAPLALLSGWTHPLSDLCSIAGDAESRFVSLGSSPKPIQDGDAREELGVGYIRPASTPISVKPLHDPATPDRVAVSKDGTFIAVSFDREIAIYDFPKFREITRIKGYNARVDSMRFLDGARLLLAGTEDKKIRIWDRLTGKELWMVEYKGAHVTSFVGVSEDESLALSGGGDGGRGLDDDFLLHLWKLPVMTSLKSPEYVPTQAELNNLDATDPDLAQLKKTLETEWEERVVKEGLARRSELDKHYVEALQRKLSTVMSATERDAYLNEISRAANNEPAPTNAPPGSSAELQHLVKIYIDQIALLRQKGVDLAKSVLQEFEGRVSTVENTRKQQGDEKGAARTKLLWEKWARAHGS